MQNELYNIYKIKGEFPSGDWQLPIKNVFKTKYEKIITEKGQEIEKNLGFRRISYHPGASTIWVEDMSGETKPFPIWFNNGEYHVRKDDILLNEFLQSHGWFNKKFYLFDADEQARQELEELKEGGHARRMVEDKDPEVRRATALTLFGVKVLRWKDPQVELELLKYANEKPFLLKKKLAEKGYKAKYVGSLAFAKGIVKENESKTAVVWNDTDEGVILDIIPGKYALTEFGIFLASETNKGNLILQEIGRKLAVKTEAVKDLSRKDKVVADKEAEIAVLKARLLEHGIDANIDNVEKTKTKGIVTYKMNTISQARKVYEEVLKEEVPVNMKNNLEWMKSKVNKHSIENM